MTSWADRIRAAKETPVVVEKKPDELVKVVATTSAAHSDHGAEPTLNEPTSIHLPQYSKGIVVLDANAFIKGLDNILSVADCLVTVPQVVREVKDQRSKDVIQRLPFPLQQLDPTPASIREVIEMSKKTGDFGVLSRTDVRIAALALDVAKQTGTKRADIRPRPATLNSTNAKANGISVIDGENPEGEDEDEDEEGEEDEEEEFEETDEEFEEEAEDGEQSTQQAAAPGTEKKDSTTSEAKKVTFEPSAKGAVDEAPALEPARSAATDASGATGVSNDDEDGEWITPSNIRQVQAKNEPGSAPFEGGMACVSSDFPIQNTLLHLGVNVVGPTGLQITQLRTWLLRCHACFALVHDTTRQFCPECGSGNTLKRVSYEVLADGTKKLYINFKRQISKRGTIYALPKPRGGRRGTNKTLALREDQLAHVQGRRVKSRKEEFDPDAVFGESKKQRFDPNKPRTESSYKKYNPNERKKQNARRRK